MRLALVKWLMGCDSVVVLTKNRGQAWRFSASLLKADGFDSVSPLATDFVEMVCRSIASETGQG